MNAARYRAEAFRSLRRTVDSLLTGSPQRKLVVLGDFNAEPDSEPIRILLDPANPEHLTHTRSVAPVRYGPEWSYHNYGRLANNMWLDYIFVRGSLETLRHGCLAEKLDDLYISDHCPVMAGLRFTK